MRKFIYDEEKMIGVRDTVLRELLKEIKIRLNTLEDEVDPEEWGNLLSIAGEVAKKEAEDLVGIKIEIMDGSFNMMSPEEIIEAVVESEVE